jgi:LysM repeat protein
MMSKAHAQDSVFPNVDAGIGFDIDAGLGFDFEAPELVEIKVRRGESLYNLARWADTEIEAIESLNGIDLTDTLDVGDTLVIPLTASGQKALSSKRDRATKHRSSRYIKRRGGVVETRAYRMRTGETVSKVARKNGRIPLWLVKSYNPKLNLNKVRIGQSITLPIMGDTQSKEEQKTSEEPVEEAEEMGSIISEDELGC